MPTIALPRYYVYILCRPNGQPFYVGKGQGDRVHDHVREARRGHRCHKCNVIRKIWRDGGQIQHYIVFHTDDEQEALQHESDLIALYDMKSLVNLKARDIGTSGFKPGARTRARQKALGTARWKDPEYRAMMLARMSAANATPEVHANRSAGAKARYADVKKPPKRRLTKSERSERVRAQWADPAIRERMIAANRARFDKPGAREQRSAINRARYADPEARAKTAAAVKEAWAKPELRERHSTITKSALRKKKESTE